MRKRLAARLLQAYVVPSLEGFRLSGDLAYRVVSGNVLLGFLLEGSAFTADYFTASYFVQPLYVPKDHVVLSLGDRLRAGLRGGDKAWSVNRENERVVMAEVCELAVRQAIPFYEAHGTPRGIIQLVEREQLLPDLIPYAEDACYSYIVAGDPPSGLDCLARNCTHASSRSDLLPYERESLARLRLILQLLTANEAQALNQLERWAEFTRAALNIGVKECSH